MTTTEVAAFEYEDSIYWDEEFAEQNDEMYPDWNDEELESEG